MTKYAVLGCGLIGSVIARDLARDEDADVSVFDASEESLSRVKGTPRVRASVADLGSRGAVAAAIAPADVVIGAVPGFLGRAMLETVIAAGKPIADISFSPQDPLELDAAARKAGVTAVIDCGVSPGLSNLAVGRAAANLDEVRDATIYVGGLPKTRRWPYEYGIVFSATDVIEEYTRPARIVRHGEITTVPALSETELLDFEKAGTLEAFLTDGLRTLLTTVRARTMQEKTLRYPGHADRMRMLRETGFFDDRPFELSTASVSPRELSEALLFGKWRMAPGEQEFTVLRVSVDGLKGGRRIGYTFDLYDETDAATGMTSMARTTGFPCAILARLLARGSYRNPGVRGLEHVAADAPAYETLVRELGRRGVAWKERVSG